MSSSASDFRSKLPPLSWQTFYLLFGITAAVLISAADGGHLLEGAIAAAIVAPTSVVGMWALRDTRWGYNWWRIGGDTDA